jgi:hypothetical protein
MELEEAFSYYLKNWYNVYLKLHFVKIVFFGIGMQNLLMWYFDWNDAIAFSLLLKIWQAGGGLLGLFLISFYFFRSTRFLLHICQSRGTI